MKTSLISLSMRGAVAAMVLTVAQFAHAHAYPKLQTPGAGSTVTTAQKDVSIEFDDALEPAFSKIEVHDATGKSVANGKAVVDAADKKRMSVALQALTPGVYTVSWVAVAADGHRTEGHYTFTVK